MSILAPKSAYTEEDSAKRSSSESSLTMSLLAFVVRNVPPFTVACVRVASVFPHSMYVERFVSSHNLIKCDMHSSIGAQYY